MEESALEFKNVCPYILPHDEVEEEADQCVYETLEKLYRHTILDLEKRADMEFFTPQYKLMYAEMEKFFRKCKNLRESNKYLQSELANTMEELHAMQKLSAIDKEMIEQLKDEIEKRWDQQTEGLDDDDEESKANKALYDQINMLSLQVSEKDGVIDELQDAINTLSTMKDSAGEHMQNLLKENEKLKQELMNCTKAKLNVEEICILEEDKLKELQAYIEDMEAELLTETSEKEQLRIEMVNMALEVSSLTEKCQKLEEDLEVKSSHSINLKNEDYVKLCAELEKANATVCDVTEKINKTEEEIEKLKGLLEKASSDVSNLEETVENLQDVNSQLTCENEELAAMLQQYETKYKSVGLGGDSLIEEEENEKHDQLQTFCTRNIFEKLSEECEKRKLQTKESFRQLKRYSGTLRDVIEGLEDQLAKL